MTARFLVRITFSLASRQIFVVAGDIVEGSVRRGQLVTSLVGLDASVDAVESVLPKAGGPELPALCFRFRDEEELAQWKALALEGQTLDLADNGAG